MNCLGCTQLETGPVKTLVDGRVVCHQCEDWRHECEARAVLAMPGIQARRDFFTEVERHRGAKAAEELRSMARKLFERDRPAGGGGNNTGSN